ncbi:MAG: hypothetical protein AVDCRST_MAG88-1843 [uncultured Thermomicrobiales bacterium]|uniref:Uncharacterized protein n=1 Tax=uncultured Thermomicrobiales bacterium TaxID=1645740 RepID=A0A6J4V130_9BACT|nr:MAG: hypothetical protein AVDCRST_MAG88-1843 [uncultured Thermomicrobiales bacterium]
MEDQDWQDVTMLDAWLGTATAPEPGQPRAGTAPQVPRPSEFTQQEWQRLVFLRWLRQQGRLDDHC